METEVKETMEKMVQANESYTGRAETFEGDEYWVVPVVMMVEGVHNGSHGPLFHSIEELGKIPEAWNGIPVTIQHPTDDIGNVSANSPAILEAWSVGKVFNTHVDGDKLKAEAYIKISKINKLSPEVFQYIKEGKPLEVSVGVFSDEVQKIGNHNGEKYSIAATNHRPDHLALLPGAIGACSWEDGCGIRVNSEGIEDFVSNTGGVDFDNTTISSDILEINSDEPKISNNKKKEEKQMAEKAKCTPCVEKKVKALIANGQTKWTDSDREWLETLEESQLDKFIPEKVEPKEIEVNVAPTKEQAIEVLRETLKTTEEFMTFVPDEIKEQMQSGLALHQERRNNMISNVLDNTKDIWTKEKLEGLDFETLSMVSNSIKPVVNYSAQNSKTEVKVNSVEPMLPAGVKNEEDK